MEGSLKRLLKDKRSSTNETENGGSRRCRLWYHCRCQDVTELPEDDADWYCNSCEKQQKVMVLRDDEQTAQVTVERSVMFGKHNSSVQSPKARFLALLKIFRVALAPRLLSLLGKNKYYDFLRASTNFAGDSSVYKAAKAAAKKAIKKKEVAFDP